MSTEPKSAERTLDIELMPADVAEVVAQFQSAHEAGKYGTPLVCETRLQAADLGVSSYQPSDVRVKVGVLDVEMDAHKNVGHIKLDGVQQRGVQKLVLTLEVGKPAVLDVTRYLMPPSPAQADQ